MGMLWPPICRLRNSHRFHPPLRRLLQAALVSFAALGLGLCSASADNWNDTQIRKLQEALIWTTDYEGLVDGKLGPGTVEAISKFQARIGNTVTGHLSSDEYIKLVKLGTANRAAMGFKQFTDDFAGVSVGIPLSLVSGPSLTKWGKHWDSKQSGLSIDTLRFDSDVSFRDLYTKLVSINKRKVAYERLVDNDWFVIAAFEGDAAVYVRANLVALPDQRSEIRGFSVWMSKNRPNGYQSIPPAMLSSFRYHTDQKNDASTNAPMGGTVVPVSSDKPPTVVENPPPRPIKTTGTPTSAGNCLNGLGDCPLLTFK